MLCEELNGISMDFSENPPMPHCLYQAVLELLIQLIKLNSSRGVYTGLPVTYRADTSHCPSFARQSLLNSPIWPSVPLAEWAGLKPACRSDPAG